MAKMKTARLNPKALAHSGAGIAAAGMLLLGIGGNVGIYDQAAQQMMRWHMYFGLTPGAIITGMIEAAIWTWVTLYLFAMLYNKLA